MEIKSVRSKVHMLPVKCRENIKYPFLSEREDKYGDSDGLFYRDKKIDGRDNPQHLYFTTDEKIESGDLYIDDCNLIRQAVISDEDYWSRRPTYRKVVATSDTSLKCKGCIDNKNDQKYFYNCKCLPQPSKLFVKKYAELGGIDEVDIEYEYAYGTQSNPGDYKIKTDSHNIITIHPIKNSWSREEVKKLIEIAWATASAYGDKTNSKDCKDWTNLNL